MKRVMVKSWEHCGYGCHVWLNRCLGTYCGYVDVPEGHPVHGRDCDDPMVCGIDVHGGVTFAEEEDGAWRVGFDCAHAGDYKPGLYVNPSFRDRGAPPARAEVWPIHRVVAEVNRMAEIIRGMEDE